VELPATFIAGVIAFVAALRSVMPRGERPIIKVFACLAGAGLVVSWLFVSTLGENNDLGLRAILLAEVVLIVMTAAGMAGLQGELLRTPIMAAALTGLALSAPDFILTVRDNVIAPSRPRDANVFAEAPDLWAAARRHSAPAARIANYPIFLADLTPWPVNISRASPTAHRVLPAGKWLLRLRHCRASAAPKSTRSFYGCLTERVHRMMFMTWRRGMAVRSSCSCRRIRLGIAIPLRPVPIIVWRKGGMVAGGSM
jgi:hypothetical protein